MALINYPPNTYIHISYKTAGATYRLIILAMWPAFRHRSDDVLSTSLNFSHHCDGWKIKIKFFFSKSLILKPLQSKNTSLISLKHPQTNPLTKNTQKGPKIQNQIGLDLSFRLRFVFSCNIDALNNHHQAPLIS